MVTTEDHEAIMLNTQSELQGSVALIAGGTSRIGRATVEELAAVMDGTLNFTPV